MAASKKVVHLLDYGAGNVRSVRNAIAESGYEIEDVTKPEDLDDVKVLVFPGVGSFGAAMAFLRSKGFEEPLKRYLLSGRAFLGICLGMQTLFEGSEESPGVAGLGIIPGMVERFPRSELSVPHMGWNGIVRRQESPVLRGVGAEDRVYFVHSFRVPKREAVSDWVLTETVYGDSFVSSVQKGSVVATQFHPEKSSGVGLKILKNFLDSAWSGEVGAVAPVVGESSGATSLARRTVACLDVRSNDDGDLVVTKGDQYDVRERSGDGSVRNLGRPVDLAARYFVEGADEIAFLNITAFREKPLAEQPMLKVMEEASARVFVPMTVGGGIRDYTDETGHRYTAVEVAARYFRAGADKVSIGSDAVLAAEQYEKEGAKGDSAIETIAHVYGSQAVVISVDPVRVYVDKPEDAPGMSVIKAIRPDEKGRELCWYQCTVRGGRERRPIDVVRLAKACQALGAGELLINCVDEDGQKRGFDLPLINLIAGAVDIPIIASSGAGTPDHFVQVFQHTRAEAALAAGIFHRNEVPIADVKTALRDASIPARI